MYFSVIKYDPATGDVYCSLMNQVVHAHAVHEREISNSPNTYHVSGTPVKSCSDQATSFSASMRLKKGPSMKGQSREGH